MSEEKPFVPGPGPKLPKAFKPVGYEQRKKAKAVAETHYEIASGVALAKAPAAPGSRLWAGKKAQEKAEPGAAALQEVRQAQPPIIQTPPRRRKDWEADYAKRELNQEQQEAEAILEARAARLKALKQETYIKQGQRSVALKFLGVSTTLLKAMEEMAEDINERATASRLGTARLSNNDLKNLLNAASTTVGRATAAAEAAVKVERLMMATPIDDTSTDEEAMENMSPEDAKKVLENLMRSVESVTSRARREQPPVVAEATEVE